MDDLLAPAVRLCVTELIEAVRRRAAVATPAAEEAEGQAEGRTVEADGLTSLHEAVLLAVTSVHQDLAELRAPASAAGVAKRTPGGRLREDPLAREADVDLRCRVPCTINFDSLKSQRDFPLPLARVDSEVSEPSAVEMCRRLEKFESILESVRAEVEARCTMESDQRLGLEQSLSALREAVDVSIDFSGQTQIMNLLHRKVEGLREAVVASQDGMRAEWEEQRREGAQELETLRQEVHGLLPKLGGPAGTAVSDAPGSPQDAKKLLVGDDFGRRAAEMEHLQQQLLDQQGQLDALRKTVDSAAQNALSELEGARLDRRNLEELERKLEARPGLSHEGVRSLESDGLRELQSAQRLTARKVEDLERGMGGLRSAMAECGQKVDSLREQVRSRQHVDGVRIKEVEHKMEHMKTILEESFQRGLGDSPADPVRAAIGQTVTQLTRKMQEMEHKVEALREAARTSSRESARTELEIARLSETQKMNDLEQQVETLRDMLRDVYTRKVHSKLVDKELAHRVRVEVAEMELRVNKDVSRLSQRIDQLSLARDAAATATLQEHMLARFKGGALTKSRAVPLSQHGELDAVHESAAGEGGPSGGGVGAEASGPGSATLARTSRPHSHSPAHGPASWHSWLLPTTPTRKGHSDTARRNSSMDELPKNRASTPSREPAGGGLARKTASAPLITSHRGEGFYSKLLSR